MVAISNGNTVSNMQLAIYSYSIATEGNYRYFHKEETIWSPTYILCASQGVSNGKPRKLSSIDGQWTIVKPQAMLWRL